MFPNNLLHLQWNHGISFHNWNWDEFQNIKLHLVMYTSSVTSCLPLLLGEYALNQMVDIINKHLTRLIEQFKIKDDLSLEHWSHSYKNSPVRYWWIFLKYNIMLCFTMWLAFSNIIIFGFSTVRIQNQDISHLSGIQWVFYRYISSYGNCKRILQSGWLRGNPYIGVQTSV